jgi:hypothetical protein
LKSIGYTGDVTLDVTNLPADITTWWFDDPVLTVPLDEAVVTTLNIVTTAATPFDLHEFTISATDGTDTREFNPKLRVGFELDLAADGSGAPLDSFSQDQTVYGSGATGTPGTHPLYVVDAQGHWYDGMSIPPPSAHCITNPVASIATDGNGDIIPGTIIWQNAQADILPSYFDIVIDVNNNGVFDVGTDVLDSYPIAGFAIGFITPPTITGMSPAQGGPNKEITITGINLGSSSPTRYTSAADIEDEYGIEDGVVGSADFNRLRNAFGSSCNGPTRLAA